jgi:hypothetical protein
MRFRAAIACAAALFATLPAHATGNERGYATTNFMLTLDGATSGFVRSAVAGEGSKKTLTITTDAPTAPLLGAVRGFFDGKVSKTSVVLSTSAVIQKANEARLVDVRLPSYAGGANDVALTFEVPATSTSPSLRAVSDKAVPGGTKLASFRLSISDLPTNEATRLDTVAFKNKEGAAIPGAFVFDVPSVSAPAFQAWVKKPAAHSGSIEYVSTTGEAVLTVKVSSCTPSSVKIDGPVTHVVVACTRARTT